MALSKAQIAKAGGVNAPAIIQHDDEHYRINLIKWLNFCTSSFDGKDAIEFFKSWGSANNMEGKIKDNLVVPTMGWVAKVQEFGNFIREADLQKLRVHWETIKMEPVVVPDVPVKQKSEPDPLLPMDAVDRVFDQFILNKDRIPAVDVSIFKDCQKKDAELYRAYIKEFQTDIDRAADEGYEWSHGQIRNARILLKLLLEALDSWMEIPKRKTRKKKVVKVEKKIESGKLSPDSKIGLDAIVGAKRVVFWCGRYNQIRIYESATGFDFAGTSLKNVTSAKAKRIRPKLQTGMIAMFSGNAQKKAEKSFDLLKTNEVVPTNQTNEQMIILKVSK